MVQLERHNVSLTWHAIALTMRSHIQWHTCVLAPVVLLFPFLPFPAVVDTAFLIRSASVYIDEFYLSNEEKCYTDDKISPIFRVFIATIAGSYATIVSMQEKSAV